MVTRRTHKSRVGGVGVLWVQVSGLRDLGLRDV